MCAQYLQNIYKIIVVGMIPLYTGMPSYQRGFCSVLHSLPSHTTLSEKPQHDLEEAIGSSEDCLQP